MKITDYDAYLKAKEKLTKQEKYRKLLLWSMAPYFAFAVLNIIFKKDWSQYCFGASACFFFFSVIRQHKISTLQSEVRSFEWKYKMWQSEYCHIQDHLGICPKKIDY